MTPDPNAHHDRSQLNGGLDFNNREIVQKLPQHLDAIAALVRITLKNLDAFFAPCEDYQPITVSVQSGYRLDKAARIDLRTRLLSHATLIASIMNETTDAVEKFLGTVSVDVAIPAPIPNSSQVDKVMAAAARA